MERRTFLRTVTAGTVFTVLGGGAYVLASDEEAEKARRTLRPDGRPRLPPNQYLLKRLKPMGGDEGDPNPGAFRLKVHGDVDAPFVLDFAALLAMPQVDQKCDVHCVTKWTVLDAPFSGVKFTDIAARAKPRASARFVIFEAAHGYTANVSLKDAMKPDVILAHKYDGKALALPHGPPVRAIVPDLYFWKSAKWLTGIRFVPRDEPGYWETRGYHNHADPWREERYG
ncbi:MAG: molybdopterin-dependent oxidoreductase [Polyangiaceae bacterium]